MLITPLKIRRRPTSSSRAFSAIERGPFLDRGFGPTRFAGDLGRQVPIVQRQHLGLGARVVRASTSPRAPRPGEVRGPSRGGRSSTTWSTFSGSARPRSGQWQGVELQRRHPPRACSSPRGLGTPSSRSPTDTFLSGYLVTDGFRPRARARRSPDRTATSPRLRLPASANSFSLRKTGGAELSPGRTTTGYYRTWQASPAAVRDLAVLMRVVVRQPQRAEPPGGSEQSLLSLARPLRPLLSPAVAADRRRPHPFCR